MITIQHIHPKCKKKVNLADIVRIEADINYCKFILKSGSWFMLSRTLKLYEDALSHPFIRVSKSCMINLQYLDKNPLIYNNIVLQSDGYEAVVSRRRLEYVAKEINDFKFLIS